MGIATRMEAELQKCPGNNFGITDPRAARLRVGVRQCPCWVPCGWVRAGQLCRLQAAPPGSEAASCPQHPKTPHEPRQIR